MRIAIDGPSGAGKSTVARLLAKRLGAIYVDTGAMYRAVALAALRSGGSPDDEADARAAAERSNVTLSHDAVTGEQRVFLNGEDVSREIRKHEVSAWASAVSRHPAVRDRLMALQRRTAEGADVVMDGRDIGTVVFPDAERKFYLTAAPEIRAARRYEEIKASGGDVGFECCLKDIVERDRNDSTRSVAPLRKAEDAVEVDTGCMTAEEAADALYQIVVGPAGRRREPPRPSAFFRFLRVVAVIWARVFYRLEVIGAENVPERGPALICSNHVSGKDMVYIGCRLRRRVRWMAKEELFAIPLLGRFIASLGAFPVRRGKSDRGAVRELYASLAAGEIVGVFPEGRRVRDPSRRPSVKRGFVTFSNNSGAPIIPTSLRYIGGPFGALGLFARVRLEFGEPVTPAKAGGELSRDEATRIAEKTMKRIYDKVDAEADA